VDVQTAEGVASVRSGRLPNLRTRATSGPALGAALLAACVLGAAVTPTASAAQEGASRTDCPEEVTSGDAIWIVGSVRELDSEIPLPGAEVALAWTEDDELREAVVQTDGIGRYRFCRLAPDRRYTLSASAVGRSGTMRSVDTRADRPQVRQDLTVALTATESGQIVGRIVDRGNGRGVEGARVRLEPAGLEVVTRYDGRFTFRDVSAGDHTLQVRHLAYGEHETDVSVTADRTTDVQVAVAEDPVEMEPLEVTVRQRYRPLEQRGYYERMNLAEIRGGEFLTPEIIQRRNPSRLSHLLGQVPSVGLSRRCRGGACGYDIVIRGCGAGGGQPAIFLDGVRYRFSRDNIRGIDEIPMQEIRAVEVYRSPSELPAEFSEPDRHCAVVLWSKSGPDRGEPGT
jgi:hypothetical protein